LINRRLTTLRVEVVRPMGPADTCTPLGGRRIHEASGKLNEFNLTEMPLQAATQV